jgi:cation:H+ antiporter
VLIDLLLIVGGAAVLAVAGDRLVDLAAALARRARLTPAVIGLTVVAAGTSMPELSVSVAAALRGSSDLAMSNVVGSNIANIGFILGACSLLGRITVQHRLLRFEYPFMVLASWILLLLCRDGSFDRVEALFFLASLGAFMAYSVWVARYEVDAAERAAIGAEVPPEALVMAPRPLPFLVLGLAAALAGLVLGAELLVRGAVSLAAALGVGERVIGLTVVAIGTSLPELVASLAAVLKRQPEMAIANVVGSNIFNTLMILGATGLLRPIAIAPRMVAPDMVVMLGFAVLLFPLVIWDRRLVPRDGAILLATYAAYLTVLVLYP